MKYKLVAIDLDGTIVHQDGAISSSDKRAIQHTIDRGMMVTFATGRMYQPSARFAQEVGINIPIICYLGALIREVWGGKVLWHKPLSLEIARRVIERIRQMDMRPYTYVDDELYLDEITERAQWYARRNGVRLNFVEDTVASLKNQPTEIAALGETANIDRLVACLDVEFGSNLLVTKSYPTFCEIGHPASGKANALEYLAKYLGVEQSQTVAIGDGINDIGMLKWSGLGIVINSNAPQEVIAAAGWVVDEENGDSFPLVMEKLLDM